MNRIHYFTVFLIFTAALFYSGCGSDTTTNNNTTGGTPPAINMKVGAFYTFNIDSIQTNGNITGTRLKTSHTYLSEGTYFGQPNSFAVRSVTKDSTIAIPLAIDTFYVRYDGGKFYQYGVLQMISPSFPASWDLVADFTVSSGTQWTIATGVPFTIGVLTGTANITGKIAVDTTFHTFGYGQKSVNAYRSEIVAELFVSTFSVGKIYVDYFIGDSDPATNPPGLVRLRLNPINITGYQAAGFEQKIQTFAVPVQ